MRLPAIAAAKQSGHRRLNLRRKLGGNQLRRYGIGQLRPGKKLADRAIFARNGGPLPTRAVCPGFAGDHVRTVGNRPVVVMGVSIADMFRAVSTGDAVSTGTGMGHLVRAATAAGVIVTQAGEQMEALPQQGHQCEKRRKTAANRAMLR